MKRKIITLMTIFLLLSSAFIQGKALAASFEEQVAQLVNQERTSRGLSPLSFSTELSRVAEDKAKDMYNNNYFSHTSPTYGSPFQMMQSYGIKYTAAGENIAKGQRSPQEVMDDWMNSSGHRANILSTKFNQIGVGYYNGYWVQMFIYSDTGAKTQTPAPAPEQKSYDPSPSVPSWQYYTVKSGDTAWKIAINNWISLSQMKVLNPNISNLSYLKVGQKVRVRAHVYKVQSGDTAWKIAQRYGMTLTELKLLNPQDETIHTLYVGQGLYVR